MLICQKDILQDLSRPDVTRSTVCAYRPRVLLHNIDNTRFQIVRIYQAYQILHIMKLRQALIMKCGFCSK